MVKLAQNIHNHLIREKEQEKERERENMRQKPNTLMTIKSLMGNENKVKYTPRN